MKKVEAVLSRFSSFQLKEMLGETLTELLTKWSVDQDLIYDTPKLASFFIQTKLFEAIKNKAFLDDLIDHLNPKEVAELLSLMEFMGKKGTDKLEVLKKLVRKKKYQTILYDYLGLSEFLLDFSSDSNDMSSISTCKNDSQFYELFDYQEIIKQRTLNLINDATKLRRLLIQMPTGTGKTKTAVHILINYYLFSLRKKGLILWIAPSEELLLQAIETFENCWSHLGNGEITIYRLWGNHNPLDELSDLSSLNGIVFVGIQKLISLEKRNSIQLEALVKNCRLIVFDEAHKALAKESFKIIEKFMTLKNNYPDRSLIGLTATPGRSTTYSEENNQLVAMFESKRVTIDPDLLNLINYGSLNARNMKTEKNIIKYFQDRGILSKLKPERLNYIENLSSKELDEFKRVLNKRTGNDYSEEQVRYLAENTSRNMEILKKLRELNAAQIPTILFAASVEHAKILTSLLKMEEINASLVLGETSPQQRKEAIEDFKSGKSNIIINYGALTTGFDSKNIQCVFITRPTQSVVLYSQMLGRGLRGPLVGGNEECLLIDVKDNLEGFNQEGIFDYFTNYWE